MGNRQLGNFSSYDSVSNMLCELGWRSLADRRIDARMILLYKIINGYDAIQHYHHTLKDPRDTLVTCTLLLSDRYTLA